MRFSLERLGRISCSISLTRPLILMELLMCWLYDVYSLFSDAMAVQAEIICMSLSKDDDLKTDECEKQRKYLR